MSKQQEIQDYLSAYDFGTAGYDATILDANHIARRYFRLWLDGSYKGENHYRRNCEQIKKSYESDKEMRWFVVVEFSIFIAHEFDCSVSHARKSIVKLFDKYTLAALNIELIDDARDLVRDQMEAA